MCVYVADLSAVDNLQSTAWDYACVRQLHYCMLIIASYLRQRNGSSSVASVGNDAGSAVMYGAFGEDLGINSLQVWLYDVGW